MQKYEGYDFNLYADSDDEEAMNDPTFFDFINAKYLENQNFLLNHAKLLKVFIKRFFIELKKSKQLENCPYFELNDLKKLFPEFPESMMVFFMRIFVYKYNLTPTVKHTLAKDQMYNRENLYNFIGQELHSLQHLYNYRRLHDLFMSLKHIAYFEELTDDTFCEVLDRLIERFCVFSRHVNFSKKLYSEMCEFASVNISLNEYFQKVKYYFPDTVPGEVSTETNG